MKQTQIKLGLIDQLAKFLTVQERGMKGTFRWDILPKAKMCRWQTSFDHTVDITWLTIIVSDYLENFYPNLDKYILLKGAFLHDFGEIIFDDTSPGDISFDRKENNNNHREGEFKVFDKLLNIFKKSELIKADLFPYYLMQYGAEPNEGERLLNKLGYTDWTELLFYNKELEAKIFTAIERLGYVIFTYQEYLTDPVKALPVLLLPLRQHVEELHQYALEIKGFSYFYSDDDYNIIKSFLESNKDVPDALKIAADIIYQENKIKNDNSVIE